MALSCFDVVSLALMQRPLKPLKGAQGEGEGYTPAR